MVAVEIELGSRSGTAAFEAIPRSVRMDALLRYKDGGDELPLGARGSVGEDNGASLMYARFFKGTIRDAVAAHPLAYDAFLRGMSKNLHARPCSLIFPDSGSCNCTRGECRCLYLALSPSLSLCRSLLTLPLLLPELLVYTILSS